MKDTPVLVIVEAYLMQIIQEEDTLASIASKQSSMTVNRWRCSLLTLAPPSSLSSLLSLCLGSVAIFSPCFALAFYLRPGLGERLLTIRCSSTGAFEPRSWPPIASDCCGCFPCVAWDPLPPSMNCGGFGAVRGFAGSDAFGCLATDPSEGFRK